MRWTYTVDGRDIPLCPDGENLLVTDANKSKFIATLIEHRLWGDGEHKELTSRFIKGFQDVLPKQCHSVLSPEELDALLQGPAQLDIEWMKRDLVAYNYGYSSDDDVVKWFWEYVCQLDKEKQARLLQFWSGSSVPPIPGALVDRWTISPHLRPISSLPTSATCTRQLNIPRYASFDQLKARFDAVIEYGYIGYSST